jgi:putative copper resistance protein D
MTGISILLRSIHLGAAIALVGSCAFLLLVARPAFHTEAPGEEHAMLPFTRLLHRLWVGSLVGFTGAGLLGLWVQQAIVTNRLLSTVPSCEALGRFLTGTHYGRVWLLRLLLAGILSSGLLLKARRWQGTDGPGRWLAGAGLAGALLVAQAWTGHAVASEGTALVWHVTVDALHLLATGVWLGGLPLLAVLVTWAQRAAHGSAERIAAEATRRFSALGLGSVFLLVVTGGLNAWTLVGTVPALVGTPYGRLVLVKISLLLPLLAVALGNLRDATPRLVRAVAARQRQQTQATLRRLQRRVQCEAALGVAILLLVGILGVAPPARHVAPTWPFAFRLSWEVTRQWPGVWARVLLGSQVALVSLLALGYAVLGQRWRGPVAGVGAVGLMVGLWVACQAMALDAYPTTYLRSVVPYQALSIANGSRLYQEHCAVCHGVAGYGDGPAAAALEPRPANLTAKHTADHTVGDLFWWLSYGIKGSAMPGFHDRLSEEERWDLINFLRILAAAEQARPLGPRIAPEPWLVAPDFSYTTVAGAGQTLKDFRGRRLVLLVFFRLPASQGRLVQLRDLSPSLQRLGCEVLAVPLHTDREVPNELETSQRLSLVADSAVEVTTTYTLFRTSLYSAVPLLHPPLPSHMEFLIDRQGYIRARWLPDRGPGWTETPVITRGQAGDIHWLPASGPGWTEPDTLITAIEQLNHEKPRAPAPDEHVH